MGPAKAVKVGDILILGQARARVAAILRFDSFKDMFTDILIGISTDILIDISIDICIDNCIGILIIDILTDKEGGGGKEGRKK